MNYLIVLFTFFAGVLSYFSTSQYYSGTAITTIIFTFAPLLIAALILQVVFHKKHFLKKSLYKPYYERYKNDNHPSAMPFTTLAVCGCAIFLRFCFYNWSVSSNILGYFAGIFTILLILAFLGLQLYCLP